MGIYTAGMPCRCCLVAADGAPILFEYPLAMHISSRIVEDVRPMMSWQFRGRAALDYARRWAKLIREALIEFHRAGEPLAVDTLDTPGFLACRPRASRW